MSQDLHSTHVDARTAAELARSDLNFLGGLLAPQSFIFAFPPFFISLFQIITGSEQRVGRYALGFPRGFAKTTWIKIVVIWHILFSDKKFILIVCAAEELAINIITDICEMLSSPNVVKLFGNWETNVFEDQKHKKVFYFRGRKIILQAIGAQTTVRGINRDNSRPDLMIMDDMQKKEDAENPELAKKLLTWMTGTLMKAASEKGCTYIFVGNMYPQNSILEKLKNAKAWTSFIVGGILADGSSLWEELKPVETLLEEWEADRELGCEDVFLSEVLNSTEIELPSGIKLDSIPKMPEYYAGTEPDGNFILIDPSGNKATSDDTAFLYCERKDGKSIATEVETGTMSPLETIRNAIKMAYRRNCRLICVEAVAYQASLLFWFNYICEQEGIIGFEFQPLSPRNQAKNRRIKRGVTRLLAEEIYLHNDVRSLVMDQYATWNPLKIHNKDELIDLVAYMEEAEMKYPHLMEIIYNAEVDSGKASEAIDMEF